MNITSLKAKAHAFLKEAQTPTDPELASPSVVVEPADTIIQQAVDKLKSINPSYFVGVRKIVVDTGQGYGHVAAGGGNDPAVIHINLSRIKSEVSSKMSGANQEQMQQEMVRQVASTIAHEKGHVASYKPDQGFVGAEQPAEAEAAQMAPKLNVAK
jgi:hypothetical protein